jgi:hypothetical protein
VARERGLRRRVDDWPDVGVRLDRVAHFQLGERTSQDLQDARRGPFVDEEDALRRAALAGALEGGDDRVVDHLLGKRRRIDEHGVHAAGLGDERHDRPLARRERGVDALRRLDRAGEGDAGDAGIGDERHADRFAVADGNDRRVGRNAGLAQDLDRAHAGARRLLRRLRDHRVAGGERSGDLSGEDGEREVPRADAGEDAAAVQVQLVALPGGSGKDAWLGEVAPRLQRVIAAEVSRLPHLGHRVGIGAAAFTHDERDELGDAPFEELRCRFEVSGARLGWRARPALERLRCAANGRLQFARGRIPHWCERPVTRDPALQGVQHVAPREIEAERVQAIRIQIAR